MNIGIDASRSIDGIQKTGVEVISDQLLRALHAELVSREEMKPVYYTPKQINWLPAPMQRVLPMSRFWTVVRLSVEMLLYKPDVFFSPVHELPFFLPKKTYRLIHDVAFLKSPAIYSTFQKWYLGFGLKRSLRVCEKIFVPTEAVKEDILAYTNVSTDKIVVTGFGFESKQKMQLPARKKQFVYIGRIEEKKNLSNVFRAFELFTARHSGYTLVLAGKDGFKADAIHTMARNSSANIRFLGYVSDEQKYQLLSESAALVHVAYEEGFGIPLLEAFDFSLPVVASDIPVLREVGGNACVYVQPHDPEAIALGMERVLVDTQDLSNKGHEQLHKFDWSRVVRTICNTWQTR